MPSFLKKLIYNILKLLSHFTFSLLSYFLLHFHYTFSFYFFTPLLFTTFSLSTLFTFALLFSTLSLVFFQTFALPFSTSSMFSQAMLILYFCLLISSICYSPLSKTNYLLSFFLCFRTLLYIFTHYFLICFVSPVFFFIPHTFFSHVRYILYSLLFHCSFSLSNSNLINIRSYQITDRILNII